MADTTEAPKRKVGRPTKYKHSMCQQVIDIMSEGASKLEASVSIGISQETMNEWSKDPNKPEFSAAVRKAVSLSKAWWESHGHKQLENKNFNATLWYMNMKNRFGWSDKQEVVASIAPINIAISVSRATELIDNVVIDVKKQLDTNERKQIANVNIERTPGGSSDDS